MNRISETARNMRNGQRGFTLLELMIVVGVVALIAAIAYPNYITAVRKGKRGQAKADVMAIAQTMERCYTQNNSYLACYTGNVLAAPNDQSPTSPPGSVAIYTVALAPAPTAQAFTVTATPVGDQVNDTCGTLTLNQAGQRTFSGSGINCW